jgi:predicted extracellular nuclease
VASTSPADGATAVAPGANVSVTFTEPVDVTGDWFTIECSSSGAHPAAVSGGPSSYVLDPSTNFGQGESCTVTVTAAQVTDQDTEDPPNAMASDRTWGFQTVACSDPDTPISAVQGPGATSPVVNTDVTVQAVVTAIRPGLSGFFVQEEAADQDGDESTSEGIFVRTTPPGSVQVGDVVQVSGGVREFTGSGSPRPRSRPG